MCFICDANFGVEVVIQIYGQKTVVGQVTKDIYSLQKSIGKDPKYMCRSK